MSKNDQVWKAAGRVGSLKLVKHADLLNCMQCYKISYPSPVPVQESDSVSIMLLNATEKLTSAVANNLKPGDVFAFFSTNIGTYVVIIITVLLIIQYTSSSNLDSTILTLMQLSKLDHSRWTPAELMLSSLMEEIQSVQVSPFLTVLWEEQVVHVSCTTIRTSAKSGTCTTAMSVYTVFACILVQVQQ